MVHQRLLVLGAVLVCASAVSAAPVAASSPVSSALQKQFEAIDAPVEKVATEWTSSLSAIPSSASQSQVSAALSKHSPAYEAALKTFDSKLAALHLPGAAGSAAAAVISEDKQVEALLGAAATMSKTQFEKTFQTIFVADMRLETTFKDAMGLQADASMVI